MTNERILIVEDERAVARGLEYALQREGYTVLWAENGQRGLDVARAETPHLVLLDIRLPDINGFDVCRRLRASGQRCPILMLTARDEELDKVLGLELGADDYIVKPFGFRELLARVRANLRRATQMRPAEPSQDGVMTIGPVAIDRRRHIVLRRGAAVALSQREYDLLLALADANGAVIRRDDLLDRVWGETWVGSPRTLDVHIRWLREKLEDQPENPSLILTVRGVGYRMVAPGEVA